MSVPANQHPDIQAALANLTCPFPPGRRKALDRAVDALAILLRETNASHSPLAWRFSRLSGDGFPVEWVFTTADHEATGGSWRYTVDSAGPDLPTTHRLGHALDLMSALGQPFCPSPLLKRLARWQQDAAPECIHYGAWIGGRHAWSVPDATECDRFKIYVEIPQGEVCERRALMAEYLDSIPYLPGREVELRILAIEPRSGRIELYFRVRDLPVQALGHLLQPIGLRHRRDELSGAVKSAYGYPLDGRFPGGSIGFSYAVNASGAPPTFTLFLFSRLLWGADKHVRQRFSQELSSAEVDPEPYLKMTAPLANRNVYETRHGLLGFSLANHGSVQLSLGVRPPPAWPSTSTLPMQRQEG